MQVKEMFIINNCELMDFNCHYDKMFLSLS